MNPKSQHQNTNSALFKSTAQRVLGEQIATQQHLGAAQRNIGRVPDLELLVVTPSFRLHIFALRLQLLQKRRWLDLGCSTRLLECTLAPHVVQSRPFVRPEVDFGVPTPVALESRVSRAY